MKTQSKGGCVGQEATLPVINVEKDSIGRAQLKGHIEQRHESESDYKSQGHEVVYKRGTDEAFLLKTEKMVARRSARRGGDEKGGEKVENPRDISPLTLPSLDSAMLTFPNQSLSRLSPWRSLKKGRLMDSVLTMMNVWWSR